MIPHTLKPMASVTPDLWLPSAPNDRDERRISTDQPVNGDCCQSESDPATCLLSNLEDVIRKPSKTDVADKCIMKFNLWRISHLVVFWLPTFFPF